MKTQRRHSLQTNELADVLGSSYEQIKPYARLIVGVLLAILVLVTTYFVLQNRAKQASEAAWSAYFTKLDERDHEGLESLARAHRDQPAGQCAALSAADHHLAQGIEELFWDRAKASDELRLAEELYQLAGEGKDPLFKQRAAFGLAMAYECQSGKMEKARTEYKRVLSMWPDSSLAAEAKSRLEDLDSDQTKEFYDWFVAQTPKMGAAGRPIDGGPTGGDFQFGDPFRSLDQPGGRDPESTDPEGTSPDETTPGDTSTESGESATPETPSGEGAKEPAGSDDGAPAASDESATPPADESSPSTDEPKPEGK